MLEAKRLRICCNGRQEQQPENSCLEHTRRTDRKNERLKEQKARSNTLAFPPNSIHLRTQSCSHLALSSNTLMNF